MPLLKQACCCCCDLRTGVITISILCLFCSVFNLCTSVAAITSNHDTLKSTFQKAGLSSRAFKGLIGFIYTAIALQVLGFIADICSLVPSSRKIPEDAKAKRQFLIPFMAWCILGCIYSVAFMVWVHVVLTGVSVAAMLIGICISILFFLWGFLVNLSYYQMLKENNGEIDCVTLQDDLTNEQPPAYDIGGHQF